MAFFVAGFLLLLHLAFWGAGLALLLAPARRRRHWAFFAPACGLALQSAVVWFAARHTGLEGTQVYARASLLLPAALLAMALRRRGWGETRAGARRAAGAFALAAVVLGALLIPPASASKTLTSMSLGSCDAADYAAGARVLTEFARGDREGFLGLTEVVRLHSVDNFFDHWLRLNHFTPAALLALNNAVFGWKFHETASVLAALLVAAAVPLVFWLARSTFGYGPVAAGWLALLYGFNPVTLYGVWHVALGQTLAAIAIALLTWCALDAWRQGGRGRRLWANTGLLLVAYWLLLGSYNFILLVCLVPAVACAGGETLLSGDWRRFGRWLLAMLGPLAAVAALFFERTAGLAERFLLFQEHDFGWKIPYLLTDGWLGLVADPHLHRLAAPAGPILAALFTGLIVWALVRGMRARGRGAFLALCVLLPIAVGYAFLQARGAARGTNASYDAYKLLAVFYPEVLAALCFGLARPLIWNPRWRTGAILCAAAVTLGHAWTFRQSAARMAAPPLMVTPALAAVQAVEARPEVASVNMRIDDFWTRLWANAFLLRKPQYFLQYTYEGRRNTPLRGEWDLVGGLLQVKLPEPRDALAAGPLFSLVRIDSPHLVRATFGEGWHEQENAPRLEPWRWTGGDAGLVVENPHPYSVRAALILRGRSLAARDVQLWRNGERQGSVDMGTEPQTVRLPPVVLAPGRNLLELRSSVPAASPGPGDSRRLGLMIQGIVLEILPAGE